MKLERLRVGKQNCLRAADNRGRCLAYNAPIGFPKGRHHDLIGGYDGASAKRRGEGASAVKRLLCLAVAVALIATALFALIGCSGSVVSRYESAIMSLELHDDGSFVLDASGFFKVPAEERKGTYTQALDGSLTFKAVAEGGASQQTFSATLDGDTLTLTIPALTFYGGTAGDVNLGTMTNSTVTLTKV